MRVPLLFAATCGAAFAMFAVAPEDVPLARLEENVKAYLAAHPDDPKAHYVLGRLYAIAYATNSETIHEIGPGAPDALPDLTFQDIGCETFLPVPNAAAREEVKKRFDEKASDPLSAEDEKRVADLVAALDADDLATREKAQADLSAMGTRILGALRKAAKDPKLTAEQQGRISTLVEALEKSVFGVWCLKKAIAEYEAASAKHERPELAWLAIGWCWEEAGHADKAIEAYTKAFDRGAEKDLGEKEWSHYSGSWHGSVGLEAGQRLLAILPHPVDAAGELERAALAEKVAALKAKVDSASEWITPIVVPLGAEDGLAALLDPTRIVRFDLVGDGRARRWPWVGPRTGILVWDPRGTGRVRHAQQLFGSYTWSIPWRNGYEPLGWLDRDGDGRLSGGELTGIAIWRDADQDGVSDAGEVASLASWGVRSLGVRAAAADEGPWCRDGVEFDGGRRRPTYDWIPRSVSGR